jgi:carboxyl-terminal processing protease
VGAAEVFAAAILDSGRGAVAGQRTYGLAAEQKTIPLDDGAALVLSVAKYHRSNGKELEDGGVEPNAPLSPEVLRRYRQAEQENPDRVRVWPPNPEEDPFLQRAIEVLEEGTSAQPKAA